MALINITDIKKLYNQLNVNRTRFRLNTLTIPDFNIIFASDISDLNDAMDQTAADSVGQRDRYFTKNETFSVNTGELVKKDILNSIQSLLNLWDNVCYYNSDDSSDDGSDKTDNDTHCPSNCPDCGANSPGCVGDCSDVGCSNDQLQVSSDSSLGDCKPIRE